MNSNYTLEQIVSHIVDASSTKLQNPYRDDVLIRSSKDVVQAIQEYSITEATLVACKEALSYFASNISEEDVRQMIEAIKNRLLMLAVT